MTNERERLIALARSMAKLKRENERIDQEAADAER